MKILPPPSTSGCNSCHTALVAVSGDKTTVINCSSRPPLTTCGVTRGFTLVELAIVLVIIGLLVGGVLVGRDLISSAEIRAQISQIEKYQTAVNTFKVKYGSLPGDIPDPTASGFGFVARGGTAGTGNDDGIMQGSSCFLCSDGENGLFWQDLSAAKLIGGNFSLFASASSGLPGVLTEASSPSISSLLPRAVIGNSIYVYVYNDGISTLLKDRKNYFGISGLAAPASVGANGTIVTVSGSSSNPRSLSVQQAYNIDNKIDDGLPFTGNVNVLYLWRTILMIEDRYLAATASGGIGETWTSLNAMTLPNPAMYPYSGSCFDNGGVPGVTIKYSLYNSDQKNCELSIKFQ